jgi:hypothetical protein
VLLNIGMYKYICIGWHLHMHKFVYIYIHVHICICMNMHLYIVFNIVSLDCINLISLSRQIMSEKFVSYLENLIINSYWTQKMQLVEILLNWTLFHWVLAMEIITQLVYFKSNIKFWIIPNHSITQQYWILIFSNSILSLTSLSENFMLSLISKAIQTSF